MAMKWLLVGIRNRELSRFNDETVTLDCEDADIVGDVFCEDTWFNILSAYGTESFDAIMTDGGLMGVRRSETIVRIKNKLLKNGGFIYNYTSVIGNKVNDPLGRGHVFYKIRKSDYTINNYDLAWDSYVIKTWGDSLRKKIRLVI
tara:strand:+ start:4278 stop:4712 length:435 start_codon:yes stop_codon:yes gene_type:complete